MAKPTMDDMTDEFAEEFNKINSNIIKNILVEKYFNDVAVAKAAVIVEQAMDEELGKIHERITKVHGAITKGFTDLGDKLDKRLKQIEDKLDIDETTTDDKKIRDMCT